MLPELNSTYISTVESGATAKVRHLSRVDGRWFVTYEKGAEGELRAICSLELEPFERIYKLAPTFFEVGAVYYFEAFGGKKYEIKSLFKNDDPVDSRYSLQALALVSMDGGTRYTVLNLDDFDRMQREG